MGPNCLNLLKPNGENSGCTGCLGVLFQKLCFKSCIDMKNAENGLLIGPKTWDRIMELFLDIWDNP